METEQQTTGAVRQCRERKPNFSESELALLFEGICEHINVLNQPENGVSFNKQKEAAYKSIANKVNQVTCLEYGAVVQRDWKDIRKKWLVQKCIALKERNARLESDPLEQNLASEEHPCNQLVLDILSGKAKVGITDFRLGSLCETDTYKVRVDSTFTQPDRASFVSTNAVETEEKCPSLEMTVKTEVKHEPDCVDAGLTLAEWADSSTDSHPKKPSEELDDVFDDNSMLVSDYPGLPKRQRKQNFTDFEMTILLREVNKHRHLFLTTHQKAQIEKQKKKAWHQVLYKMQKDCGITRKRTVQEIKKKWTQMKLVALREKRAFEKSNQTGPFVSASPYTRQVFAILDGTFDDWPSADVEEVDFEALLNLDTSPNHDPVSASAVDSQSFSPHNSSDLRVEKYTHGRGASFSDSEIKCMLKEVQKHYKILNTTPQKVDNDSLEQRHWQMIADKVNSCSEAGVIRSWKNIQKKFQELKLSALATKGQVTTAMSSPSAGNISLCEYNQLVLEILSKSPERIADDDNDSDIDDSDREVTCEETKGSDCNDVTGATASGENIKTENINGHGKESKQVHPPVRQSERHLSALPSSEHDRTLADIPGPDDSASRRGPNFTEAEVTFMLDLYEANKHMLNSKKIDPGINLRKHHFWQIMTNKLAKFAGPQSPLRTCKQVRKKIHDVRSMAMRSWRGQEVKGRPPWMSDSVLKRILTIMGVEGGECREEATISDSFHNNDIKVEQESGRTCLWPNKSKKRVASEQLRAGLVSEVAKFKDVLFTPSPGSVVDSEHIAWTLVAEKVNVCSPAGLRWTEKELQQLWADLVQEVEEYTTALSQGEDITTKPTHYLKISEILQSCSSLGQLDDDGSEKGNDIHDSEVAVQKTSRSSSPPHNDLGLAINEGDNDCYSADDRNDSISDKGEDLNHAPHPAMESKRTVSSMSSNRDELPVMFGTAEADVTCIDKRGANFTEAEVMVMINFYVTHRHVLTSKKNDSKTNLKKHRAWQSMANRLNRLQLAGPHASRRTTKQVRKKMHFVRNAALRYWKGQQIKAKPPWMTRAVLEQIVKVMDLEGRDSIKSDPHESDCDNIEDSMSVGSHDDSTNQDQVSSRGWPIPNSNSSDARGQGSAEGNRDTVFIDRQRGPNFTASEVMVMLDFCEANSHVLNSKKNDSVTQCKKQRLWRTLAMRLNKMADKNTSKRTAHQVRVKLKYIRGLAHRCIVGGEAALKGKPLWLTKCVLERITRIMDLQGTDPDSFEIYRDIAGEEDFTVENNECCAETSGDKEVSATAAIQTHLNTLLQACNALRKLGVDAGSVVFENNTVMACGSERLTHPTSQPHLLALSAQELESLSKSKQNVDKMADQWQVIISDSKDPGYTGNLPLKTHPDCTPTTQKDLLHHTHNSPAACHTPTSPSSVPWNKSQRAACDQGQSNSQVETEVEVSDDSLHGDESPVLDNGQSDVSDIKQRLKTVLHKHVVDTGNATDSNPDVDREQPIPVSFPQQQLSSARHGTQFTCDLCPAAFSQMSHLVLHRQSHTTTTRQAKETAQTINSEETIDDDSNDSVDINVSNDDVDNRDASNDNADDKDVSVDKVDNDNAPGSRSANNQPYQTSKGKVQLPDCRPRRYACPYCGQRFYTASHRRQHIRLHTGEKPFKCEVCGFTFTQLTSLTIHRRKHKGERPYRCAPCNVSFYSSSDLLAHSKRWHGHLTPKLQTQLNKYKCEDCGQVLSDACRLKIHRRKHTGEKPFTCDICQRSFTEKNNLRRHQERHLGTKAFQCEVCGANFTEKGNLKVHMRYHTGDRPYSCEFCGESFYVTSTLKIHRRKHTGERPYLCDVCGASFIQGSKLILHRRSHTGEKPYKCEDCGEAYRDKSRLNVHRRKHTGVQPYTCGVCGKHMSNAWHLNTHLRLHTGEKPYECEVCGDRFSRSDVLLMHRRKHAANLPTSESSQPAKPVLDPAMVVTATQPILGRIDSQGLFPPASGKTLGSFVAPDFQTA